MELTRSGIDALGEIKWGSHFCHFYHDDVDLGDTLVPYFKAGLENNEKCLWITSEPLLANDARAALRNEVPNLTLLEKRGQIEIYNYSEWYLKTGKTDIDSTVKAWVDKQSQALEEGYTGLRLTGNTYWLERNDWKAFTEYEQKINHTFFKHRIVGLCSYCMQKSLSTDVFDVIRNHDFALLRQNGDWELVETSKLRASKDQLQKLNTELKANLKQAKDAAESANRLKTYFLANMSHEIRTPLGAVLGYCGLLKDSELSPKERAQYIDTITRNGNALTRIIDDILDLAKVEAGKLEVEETEFSIFDLLTEAVDLYKDKAKQKGIYLLLNIEEGVTNYIYSDRARLRQILINLIGNAVKFTEKGGVRICVKSKLAAEGALKVTVEIKDTGIGMTTEQANGLFHPFAQADNASTRRYGGTGLGLALSQRLAAALGGKIVVQECEPSRGCTFALDFVASEGSGVKINDYTRVGSDQTKVPKRSLENVKVLVVDDSPDNLFLVKRMLIKYGALVEVAHSGKEAIQKGLAEPFDVILMDIQMPDMDGYEAAATLFERQFKKPIIALTAHAMKDQRMRTQALGFSGHLTKPLNTQELIETIASVTAPQ